MLIGWICFFVAVEFYGVSVALLTASENGKCDFRYLIPFYAFFREKDIAGEFKVIGIPVKKCGNAVILLAAIAFVASMITLWGSKNFAAFPEKIGCIKQIMAIPEILCAFAFYLIIVKSAIRTLFVHKKDFKGDWLCCALILPLPYLFGRKIKEETV